MRTTTSDNQRATARINGAKSRGPITQAGKARAAHNSIRHGLDSKTVVLPNESQPGYNHLLASYHHEWQPQSQPEHDAVQQMVDALWRLRRIKVIEDGAINATMRARLEPFNAAFPNTTPEMRQADAFFRTRLDHLGKYHARYERAYHRAQRNLLKLRRQRALEASKTAYEPQPAPALSWLARLLLWIQSLLIPRKPAPRPRRKRVILPRNLTILAYEPQHAAPCPT